MEDLRANESVVAALRDLLTGHHLMMDNLIQGKNYHEAEAIARQVDERLIEIIDSIKVSPR